MFRIAFRSIVLTLVCGAAAFAADHEVVVGDNFFSPATLTIAVGDSVTWSNTGQMPHNVRADNNAFRSGNASAAEWTYTFVFNTVGDFRYYCELHGAAGGLGMAGRIIV